MNSVSNISGWHSMKVTTGLQHTLGQLQLLHPMLYFTSLFRLPSRSVTHHMAAAVDGIVQGKFDLTGH